MWVTEVEEDAEGMHLLEDGEIAVNLCLVDRHDCCLHKLNICAYLNQTGI